MIATSTVVIYTDIAPRWLAVPGFALTRTLSLGSFLSQLELPLCSRYGCFRSASIF